MKTINFGIIGCGNVTEVKSGPAFQKVEGSNLLAVMRRDEEKLADYAKRHRVPKYSTNYMDLLEDKEIDAIYIATPPHMHHYYTLEAAKYGKAVYVEKPMARTAAECEEMIKACKQYNVPLFVAYYRREHARFKKIKELIESGEIGEVRSFHYLYTSKVPSIDPNRSWLMSKEYAGGGLLYDIGSHMIDTMTFIFGDIKMATGISANQSGVFSVNDVTSGFIQFKNKIQGSIQLSFNGNERRDELTIIGSRGSIKSSIMSSDFTLYITKDDTSYEIPFPPLEHVQLPLITRIVNTLLEKDNYDTTGLYGLKTQEILETLENSRTIVY